MVMLRVEALAAWEARRREQDAARMEWEEAECKRANNLAVREWGRYSEATYYNRELRAPVVAFDDGVTRLALRRRGSDGAEWYVVWDCPRCAGLIVGHTPVRDMGDLGQQIESGPSKEDLYEHGCAARSGRRLSENRAEEVA